MSYADVAALSRHCHRRPLSEAMFCCSSAAPPLHLTELQCGVCFMYCSVQLMSCATLLLPQEILAGSATALDSPLLENAQELAP